MATSTLGWKLKPSSPLAYAEEDVWLFPKDEKICNTQNNDFSSLTRKEIAQQLLQDIDGLVKNEEEYTFSHWVEETVDLPIFDEIQPVLPSEELKPGLELIQDIDGSLNEADLTPPHSPQDANADSYIILDYDAPDILQFSDENVVDFSYQSIRGFVVSPDGYALMSQNLPEQSTSPAHNFSQSVIHFPTAPPTLVPDLEKEMAVVDEVVRSTAQSLENNIEVWESEISNSQSSSSESVKSFEGGIEDESDDPEWMPGGKVNIRKAINPLKRAKPHGREKSQVDRWLRKKEQNKNAATRYRQKKKAEVSEILEEEKMLEEKKRKLKQRLSDIQMEIKYLKGLMRDLFKAKDLLIN